MESWPGLQIGDGLRVSLGVMLGRLFALLYSYHSPTS